MNGDEKRIVILLIALSCICGSLLTYVLPWVESLFRAERVVVRSRRMTVQGEAS